jgi:hypothetical protein
MIDKACGVPEKTSVERNISTDNEEYSAWLVAEKVINHIDTMYPAMWKSVPKCARKSVRNTVYNNTLAALMHHRKP